jgi:hypothetical protein
MFMSRLQGACRIMILWSITPTTSVEFYWRFGGKYHLSRQVRRKTRRISAVCSPSRASYCSVCLSQLKIKRLNSRYRYRLLLLRAGVLFPAKVRPCSLHNGVQIVCGALPAPFATVTDVGSGSLAINRPGVNLITDFLIVLRSKLLEICLHS